LINETFPSGIVHWAGKDMPLNSMLLDLTAILFAAQLVVLLGIGPYADYGKWRPWLMIIFSIIVYLVSFALCGISKPSQWQGAQALYVIGSLATNVVGSFFQGAFPGIVRDLPKLIESEQAVINGEKSAEDHAKLDAHERAQLYNWINTVGSALVVISCAIAVGISAAVGFETTAKLIKSYRILLGYFGIVTALTSAPFFIVYKHRPGQQLPVGTKWYLAGPK
jgi:hypothetical protein